MFEWNACRPKLIGGVGWVEYVISMVARKGDGGYLDAHKMADLEQHESMLA